MGTNRSLIFMFILSFFSTSFGMQRDSVDSKKSREKRKRGLRRSLLKQKTPPKRLSIGQEKIEMQKDQSYYEKLWAIWKQSAPSMHAYRKRGYVIFMNKKIMHGRCSSYSLPNLVKLSDDFKDLKKQLKTELARRYKIHLMPDESSIAWMIETICKRLHSDARFQKSLGCFKVRDYPEKIEIKPGLFLPVMVLYPDMSKDAAQYVLDTVYGLFKSVRGTGRVARYNCMINDLIGWAQGDGDCKDDAYAQYYDEERVCYKPTFVDARVMENYYLKDPSKKNNLFC